MPRRVLKRIAARSRKLLPLLLLQLLMVGIIALIAWGSWSVRRNELVSDAHRRSHLQGSLISAVHATMLNTFSTLATDLGTIRSISSMTPKENLSTEALLASFVKGSITYNRAFLLDENNKIVLSARRDDQNLVHHADDSGSPFWLEKIPEETLQNLDTDGFLIQYFENCGFSENNHAYLAGLPIYNENGERTGAVLIVNKFGLFSHWILGVARTDEIQDYLLDYNGKNMIPAPPSSDPAHEDQDVFLNEFSEEYKRLRDGEDYLVTKQGIFISHQIVWNEGERLSDWAKEKLGSLNWVVVAHVPMSILRQQQWASIRWLLLFGLLIDFFASWLLLTSLRARRERALAQRRVNQMNKTLTSIINGSPLAMIVLDRRGHVLHWNSAAEAMFGWKAEEVIGQFNPVVGNVNKEMFFAVFNKVVSSGEPIELDTAPTHRDGHKLDLHLWSTAIAFIDGRASAILGIYADVSEQHRRQAAEAKAKEVEAARMMARTVAHEFRQPLAALSIMAELTEMNGFDPAEVNKMIQRVPNIISRMDGLVDKLLQLSEIHDKTYWRDINILDLEQTGSVSYPPVDKPEQN